MPRALISIPLNETSLGRSHAVYPPILFTPASTPDRTIQVRLTNAAQTLEFRFLFTNQVADRAPSTWDFDFPLICQPVIWESLEGAMVVLCLTVSTLYRFVFEAPNFFAEVGEEEGDALEEWSLEDWGFETTPGDRKPFLACSLGQKEGVALACEDGTLWAIERDTAMSSTQWNLVQLSHSSGLNPFSAIASRFTSQNIGDVLSSDLILDMATANTNPPLLFAVTRTRRLRVWDLNTQVCLYSSPERKTVPLPPNRRRLLRINVQNDGTVAVVLYNPTEQIFSLFSFCKAHGGKSLVSKEVAMVPSIFGTGIRECVDFLYYEDDPQIWTVWDEPDSVGGTLRIYDFSSQEWETILPTDQGENEDKVDTIESLSAKLPSALFPTSSEAVLREDDATGESLYDTLEDEITEEWRKWSAIVEQQRRSDLVPLGFGSTMDGITVLRDGWGVVCEVEEKAEDLTEYDFDIWTISQDVEKNGLEEAATELVSRLDGVEELESISADEVQDILKALGDVSAPQMDLDEESRSPVTWELSHAMEIVLKIMIDNRWVRSRTLICRLVGMYAREEPMERWEELFSAALAMHHSWSVLRWLGTQQIEFTLPLLSNGEGIPVTEGRPSSLLHILLLTAYRPSIPSNVFYSEGVKIGISGFFSLTDLLTSKRLIVASPSDVKFAYKLFQLGMYNAALQWTEMFPGTAGMKFVKAMAEVELGRLEDAREDFEKAASGIYENEFRFDDDSGLLPVIPHSAAASLARYYAYVACVFEPKEAFSQTAQFTKLALDVWSLEKDGSSTELWSRLFRSYAQLGEFDDAYEVLMTMPSSTPDIRPECLRNLVSLMCENGATNRLLKYSFGPFVKEFEQTLDFRAKNSDTLSTPNYYRILYAYYISKSDYRNAALTMYLHAQRIEDTAYRSGDPRRHIKLQAQSYLAAINALSLVEPKEQAWICVNVQASKLIGQRKRKIQYVIPDKMFSPSSVKIDVLEVDDIRKEHAMAVSWLRLADDYPELLQRSNPLTPDVVVSLLAEKQDYEIAFDVAFKLEEDMSNLFGILTEKCLQLGTLSDHQALDSNLSTWVVRYGPATTWQGSYSARAWRILQNLLQRYDSPRINHSYHAIVLARILDFDRSFNIPNWLIEFYLEKFPDHFIRAIMRYNLIKTAFEFSIQVILRNQNLLTISPPKMSCSMYLPHNCFNILLDLSEEDGQLGFPSALSKVDLDGLKQRLSEALQKWFSALKRIEDGLKAVAREKATRFAVSETIPSKSISIH